MKIPALTLALLLPAAASARIGETPSELEARYGAAIDVQPNCLTYKKNGFLIIADLYSGKCYSIAFSRDGGVSETHVETLRNANCGTQSWTELSSSGKNFVNGAAVRLYHSADGMYSCTVNGNMLLLQHRKAAEQAEALRAAAERAKEAEAVKGL